MVVRRSVLPGILVLLLVAVSLAACSTAGSVTPSAGGDGGVFPDGVVVGDLNFDPDDLPTFDPQAPLPSPGAAALRALMVLDPSVADLEGDVEAAERAAMVVLLADLRSNWNRQAPRIHSLASHSGGAKVAPGSPALRSRWTRRSWAIDGLDSSHCAPSSRPSQRGTIK
jgi:hypothetical protein